MPVFMIIGLIFIGFIAFLGLTKDNIPFPIPAEERLDPASIKLITESISIKLNR